MQITILNKDISTQQAKKPGGKPYQLVEVAFKNNSFGGAVQGKKITSYSKAFQAVVDANIGSSYEVATEKNGEFVEWVSLSPVGTSAAVPPVVAAGQMPKSTGAFTGTAAPRSSTYETPEERAKKQVYIVRQSSISNAVAALSVGGKTKLAANDVIEEAKKYEAYVFGTATFPNASGFEDLPDFDPSFNTDPQID